MLRHSFTSGPARWRTQSHSGSLKGITSPADGLKIMPQREVIKCHDLDLPYCRPDDGAAVDRAVMFVSAAQAVKPVRFRDPVEFPEKLSLLYGGYFLHPAAILSTAAPTAIRSFPPRSGSLPLILIR